MAKTVNKPAESVKNARLKTNKLFPAVLLGVLIFALGVNIGNGQLNIGPDAIFRKSVGSNKNLPNNLSYSSVEKVYDAIRADYDGELDEQKLLDGLKQGLAEATGDPYTEYFNAGAAKDFNDQLNGTFSGIGAELGKDKDGNIVVIAPIAGFPAEKAGLRAQDIITSVNDDPTSGKSISEVVSKIRGPVDSKVTLKVVRDKSAELKFEITRAEIKVPSVTSEITPDNIGILKISRFSEDTAALARTAADSFKQANVKGVVLDMRDNPGGLLDQSVEVASLWLTSDKIVLQEKRGGVTIKTFKASGQPTLGGIPTVVLINEGSASASEITAGALHDNKAATLLGKKSYGKGSVQSVECLEGSSFGGRDCTGAFIKITIAHWYTPAGINIDKQGIEPDQKVERTDDDFKNNVDPQKDKALEFLKK